RAPRHLQSGDVSIVHDAASRIADPRRMHAGVLLVIAVTGLAACRDSPSERPAPPSAPASAPPVAPIDAAAEPPANLVRPVRRTVATGALLRCRPALDQGGSCEVVVT